MPCVYSNADQSNEVIGSSSPVAVNRFAEGRVSVRNTRKVSCHFTIIFDGDLTNSVEKKLLYSLQNVFTYIFTNKGPIE